MTDNKSPPAPHYFPLCALQYVFASEYAIASAWSFSVTFVPALLFNVPAANSLITVETFLAIHSFISDSPGILEE